MSDEHAYTSELWKPDGQTAYYGATCSCGWYETVVERYERRKENMSGRARHALHVAAVSCV